MMKKRHWLGLLPPILSFGAAPDDRPKLPAADCEHCKYRGRYQDQHCYKVDEPPGDECGEFRVGN